MPMDAAGERKEMVFACMISRTCLPLVSKAPGTLLSECRGIAEQRKERHAEGRPGDAALVWGSSARVAKVVPESRTFESINCLVDVCKVGVVTKFWVWAWKPS
eukprot:886688-Amphidinium_carterae.1